MITTSDTCHQHTNYLDIFWGALSKNSEAITELTAGLYVAPGGLNLLGMSVLRGNYKEIRGPRKHQTRGRNTVQNCFKPTSPSRSTRVRTHGWCFWHVVVLLNPPDPIQQVCNQCHRQQDYWLSARFFLHFSLFCYSDMWHDQILNISTSPKSSKSLNSK